jgi:hypothetical protein
MTNDEKIQRAQRAKALIDDPIMAEATAHIEAECWRLFKTFAPTDTEGIMQIKSVQYMHEKYLNFLRQAIADGKMAQLEVDRTRPKPSGY